MRARSSEDPPRRPPTPGHHRRQTEHRLLAGFLLILFLVGGGLIAWNYGWGGLAGGLACFLSVLGLGGLLWLLLGWAGRWANRG